MSTLYYVLDPMCSWCYAFSPTWKKVLKDLPEGLHVNFVHGGLAPHSNEDMPQDMQEMLQGVWQQIEQSVGTKFNFDFWKKCKPRRSTYLACQACVAARLQDKEVQMIKAIQELYYQKASNPSDESTLILAAKNIGLDIEKFSQDLNSKKTIKLFENDLKKRRDLSVNSFPSLVLEHNKKLFAIRIEYKNHEAILKQIHELIKS